MQRLCISVCLVCLVSVGCSSTSSPGDPDNVVQPDVVASADLDTDAATWSGPDASVDYTEDRVPCSNRNALRNLYWGDLHGHTLFSFDAQAYQVLVSPAEAYAFAQGQSVALPPLDADGKGTRVAQLARPLDFAALTDHSEYLGEIHNCTVEGSPGYESATCQDYRDPNGNGAFQFGTPLSNGKPVRFSDVCGDDGADCVEPARKRWAELVAAADEASDRSATCSFTALPAYEYTNTTDIANLHRNVLFRNNAVPELPVTHFEAPTPLQLWQDLDQQCLAGSDGCDVMVIPHNSNLSNGNMFYIDPSLSPSQRKELAQLRARLEPVVEIFQHKGDSECRNGFAGNPDDPFCEFEKLRPADDTVCDGVPGMGGMRLWGCSHPLDFVRNVLKQGLATAQSTGTNPYALGFIGSTDTHNGTLGLVDDTVFEGHIGIVDDTVPERVGAGNETHDGIINNPGGLAAVWAVENSRDAVFEALRRREVYATSGPRITVRFFGGWDLAADACSDSEDLVKIGYRDGVPMGAELPARQQDVPPTLVVRATMDAGTADFPGAPLERIQMVKGWLDDDGNTQEQVFDVAGGDTDWSLDDDTCETAGAGHETLCAAWTDPDFNATQRAFYYPRILEVPTCRWSSPKCDALPVDQRPATCDNRVPRAVQHRAWASPIFYVP